MFRKKIMELNSVKELLKYSEPLRKLWLVPDGEPAEEKQAAPSETQVVPPNDAAHSPTPDPEPPKPCAPEIAFDLRSLVDFWQALTQEPAGHDEAIITLAASLSTRLADSAAAFPDHAGLSPLIKTALVPFVSLAQWRESMVGISRPFSLDMIHASEKMSATLLRDATIQGEPACGRERFAAALTARAYAKAATECWGVTLKPEPQDETFYLADAEGVGRYYRLIFDHRFCTVRKNEDFVLTFETRAALEGAPVLSDIARLLPADSFSIHGFSLIWATEVTRTTCLANIHRLSDASQHLVLPAVAKGLRHNLRSLMPDTKLKMGLSFLQGPRLILLTDDCLPEEGWENSKKTLPPAARHHYESLLHAEPFREMHYSSGSAHLFPAKTEEKCVRSWVTPLDGGGKPVGLLHLYHHDANYSIAEGERRAIAEITPVLAEIIEREVRLFENAIQSVILEKYTAVHPSVAWRFAKAALDYLEKKMDDEMPDDEPIIFKKVYPLYGISDIRGSSSKRNQAVQKDLIDQLMTAQAITQAAYQNLAMPVLGALAYEINSHVARLGGDVCAEDEISIFEFLKQEVEDVFRWLKREGGEEIARKIDAYHAEISPEHNMFYRARRDFDQSIALLNEAISSYMDEEQKKIQEVFPHYFEKQSTDGVDHSIYIGQSMTEDREFHPVHLENIRLWQLMIMCQSAFIAENLRETLPTTIDLTHLIVVQENPLTVKFQLDEKKFDVHGAYNIRYEIIKKRIDKATVKGGVERLTQPGSLAIVYSQKREYDDYMKYIAFLKNEQFLIDPVEEFDLEDMPGIKGLKAIRVGININQMKNKPSTSRERLLSIVQHSQNWLTKKRKELGLAKAPD